LTSLNLTIAQAFIKNLDYNLDILLRKWLFNSTFLDTQLFTNFKIKPDYIYFLQFINCLICAIFFIP
jgi:hypothetical protein